MAIERPLGVDAPTVDTQLIYRNVFEAFVDVYRIKSMPVFDAAEVFPSMKQWKRLYS